jgi:hypothetical protein
MAVAVPDRRDSWQILSCASLITSVLFMCLITSSLSVVFDHFVFVGSDEVGLLSWLNPGVVDVLLTMNLINWPFEFICNLNL